MLLRVGVKNGERENSRSFGKEWVWRTHRRKGDKRQLAYGQYSCPVMSCTWSIQSDPSSHKVPLWILFVGEEL